VILKFKMRRWALGASERGQGSNAETENIISVKKKAQTNKNRRLNLKISKREKSETKKGRQKV
jgi:hypothetical protein